MPLVLAADARRTATPNAVMTTLASPSVGASTRTSVWRVSMAPGAAGPEHAVDAEQVWTILDGRARVHLADEVLEAGAGDTVVLPAGLVRRIVAVGALEALVAGPAGMLVSADGRPDATPPWMA